MNIANALHNVQRLGVDSAPLIYFIEANPDFVDRARNVFQYADTRQIALITSVITIPEVLSKPLKSGDSKIVEAYRSFLLQTTTFEIVSVNFIIAEKAARLRAQYNLRTPDALQLATAIIHGCQAFFTNDSRLQHVTELRVLLVEDIT